MPRLGALLEATQASAGGAGAGTPAVREAHRDFAALVFSLHDVSQCCARVVSNNLPELEPERLSAQQALARERALAVRQLRKLRRSLTMPT